MPRIGRRENGIAHGSGAFVTDREPRNPFSQCVVWAPDQAAVTIVSERLVRRSSCIEPLLVSDCIAPKRMPSKVKLFIRWC